MSYQDLNPTESKRLIEEEDWTYLDVRTVEEFEAGHAPGAFNAPVFFRGPGGMEPNEAFVEGVKRLFEADSKLVLGCAAGVRSARACELLAVEGFTSLVNMHGGFSGARDATGAVTEPGWAACGFEVTTESDEAHRWRTLSDA